MTVPFKTDRIHHVAYRCKDAKETVEWYERVLGFTYTNAFAEDRVLCLAAGMDGFLSKPVLPGRLYAEILTRLTAARG